jgi:hypothetical protein
MRSWSSSQVGSRRRRFGSIRRECHRLSGAHWEGKDGNPLNELRMLIDTLISHKGVMRADKQIKLPPE